MQKQLNNSKSENKKYFQVGVLVSTEAKPSAQLVWDTTSVLDELIPCVGPIQQIYKPVIGILNIENSISTIVNSLLNVFFSKTPRLFEWTHSIGFATCKSNNLNIENSLSIIVICFVELVLPQTTVCLDFSPTSSTNAKHLRFHEFNGFKRFHYKISF